MSVPRLQPPHVPTLLLAALFALAVLGVYHLIHRRA